MGEVPTRADGTPIGEMCDFDDDDMALMERIWDEERREDEERQRRQRK